MAQVTTHPLLLHKLTILRNLKTSPADFRNIVKEITFYLGYDATRGLNVVEEEVTTPVRASFAGAKVSDAISIIPILRAGLVMGDAMLDLLPKADVHHIGMYRSKHSPLPIQYYNRLPKNGHCDVAFVCDPCIATSRTLGAVVSMVKKWGAKKVVVISIVASKEGLASLHALHPDIAIHVAAVDDHVSENGMIVPGIGDAGDRMFGKPCDAPEVSDTEVDDEGHLVSKKPKRELEQPNH